MHFVRMYDDIMEDEELNAYDRIILSVIRSFGSKGFYGSQSTLCKYCGCKSSKTVNTEIKKLIERGYISMETRKGSTNIYKYTKNNISDDVLDLEQWKKDFPEEYKKGLQIQEEAEKKKKHLCDFSRILSAGVVTEAEVLSWGVLR